MVVREGENLSAARLLQMMHKIGGPALKQPTSDCRVLDKYQEL